MNISAYRYTDFDAAILDPNQAVRLNSSAIIEIDLIVDDDEDEADKRFIVEMVGPNVGDGIKQIDITLINNERKYMIVVLDTMKIYVGDGIKRVDITIIYNERRYLML